MKKSEFQEILEKLIKESQEKEESLRKERDKKGNAVPLLDQREMREAVNFAVVRTRTLKEVLEAYKKNQ